MDRALAAVGLATLLRTAPWAPLLTHDGTRADAVSSPALWRAALWRDAAVFTVGVRASRYGVAVWSSLHLCRGGIGSLDHATPYYACHTALDIRVGADRLRKWFFVLYPSALI